MTHDYMRHGTTDLFAALNTTSGDVLTHCRKSHAAADVLQFVKQIDAGVASSAFMPPYWLRQRLYLCSLISS